MSIMRSASRLLLSGIFISGGAQAFIEPGERVKKVAEAGIQEPKQVVELNGAIMIIGGILLASGVAPKLAAGLLMGSLVPTTFVGHAFWKEKNEIGRKNQLTQFFKNLGLLGGLLLVITGKE
jgi:putative oxidoreductase